MLGDLSIFHKVRHLYSRLREKNVLLQKCHHLRVCVSLCACLNNRARVRGSEFVTFSGWISHCPGHDGPEAEVHQDTARQWGSCQSLQTGGAQGLHQWTLPWGPLPHIPVSECQRTEFNGGIPQKAPHSLYSALTLTRTPMVKSRALYREYGAIWDKSVIWYCSPSDMTMWCHHWSLLGLKISMCFYKIWLFYNLTFYFFDPQRWYSATMTRIG
jgi:hypothetical protein